MNKVKEKINKYINDKGLLKTPAHYIKELLIGIVDKIDKIDETVDKADKSIKESIEQNKETIEQNIIPYIQNKIIFDTEELNIDTKNGYYYTVKFLENFKIT